MTIFFVISGKLKNFEQFTQKLHKVFVNHKLELFATNKVETANIVTNNIINNHNPSVIVIVGGDGTINECINSIMGANSQQKANIKLGIIPTGTGNDFAKSLKITSSLSDLLFYIENNKSNRIDICKMDFTNHNNIRDTRYFINIADIGIGALVVKKINDRSKKFMTGSAYFRAILSSFFIYRRKHISFKSNNFNWQGEILSLCMANGSFFGNGLCIAPQAKLNNGKISIVILGKVSVIDYLLQMRKAKKGKLFTLKEVTYKTVNNCTIKSLNNTESPIDMDGEFIGYTPIKVNVLKQHVNVFSN